MFAFACSYFSVFKSVYMNINFYSKYSANKNWSKKMKYIDAQYERRFGERSKLSVVPQIYRKIRGKYRGNGDGS